MGQARQILQGRHAVVRMHEADEIHAQRFDFRPLEDLAPGGIDGDDHAGQVRHQHDVGRQPPHAVAVGRAVGHFHFQRGIQVGHLFQHVFLFLHVRIRAHPAQHRARLVEQGQGARQEPAVGAVAGAAHAELVFVGAGRGDGPLPAFLRGLHVVRMHAVAKAAGDQRLQRLPRVLAHLLIDPVGGAAAMRQPGLVGHGRGERTELCLAVEQGIARLPVLVDVFARAIPFHGLAALVEPAIRARVHPAVAAVLAAHAHFLVQRLAAAQRFAPRRQCAGHVLGVDVVQPAGAQAIAARPFAPALRHIVELAVDVGRPQHLRVQFDGVMKVFAAVVQRSFQLAPLDDMRGHARGQRQQFDFRLRGMA